MDKAKLIFLFLCISIIFLSSCDSKIEVISDNDKGIVDKNFISETETNKEWDIKLLLSICESYEMACPNVTFGIHETVDFVDVFPYFMLKGCNNTYFKTIREEISEYIDEKSGNFIVPCEIVEEYLTRRFDTTIEREKIKYYNAEKNVTNLNLF